MNSNSAAENLQVIRTLMERSALYRRALAPIMIFAGSVGVLASIVALLLHIESLHAFGMFWLAVAAISVAGAFMLARRQSLKDQEPFWSPPTRRVAQALLAPLMVGFVVSVQWIVAAYGRAKPDVGLPIMWMLCYGCALHSAGFFVPRGIKFLGWFFILCAFGVYCCCIMFFPAPDAEHDVATANIVMGVFFGLVHLAYGTWLYFTENRKDAA